MWDLRLSLLQAWLKTLRHASRIYWPKFTASTHEIKSSQNDRKVVVYSYYNIGWEAATLQRDLKVQQSITKAKLIFYGRDSVRLVKKQMRNNWQSKYFGRKRFNNLTPPLSRDAPIHPTVFRCWVQVFELTTPHWRWPFTGPVHKARWTWLHLVYLTELFTMSQMSLKFA